METDSFQQRCSEPPFFRRTFLTKGLNLHPNALFVLLLFSFALQIFSIWNLELSGADSPRVAGIAREMAVTSNYLIPRLNGENFLEYPPLGYWPFAIVLSKGDNPSDFLAFLPLPFLAMGTVLITYLIGKTLAGKTIGLLSGYVLSTMTGFITLHRHCRVDPVLLFFITLSLYGFTIIYQTSRKTFFAYTVFYLAMAGGFLSKGVIGVAVPITTVLMFLITRRDPASIRKLFLNPGILFFLLPILIWGGSVWWIEGPNIIIEIIQQSFLRFFSPSADHAKPFYFYLIHSLSPLTPWVVLPFILLGYRLKFVRSREPLQHSSLFRFSLIWFLVVFIGLSLSSAKRGLYLGPLYPPFALLTALGWNRIREKYPKVKPIERYGLMVMFLVLVLTCLLLVTPGDNKESLRSVFKTLTIQHEGRPIYLVNPSETIRGASFFYLGRRIPVLRREEFLSERFEDQTGAILVIDSLCDNHQLPSNLSSRGYRLLLQNRAGKNRVVCIYSRHS